MTVTDIFLNQKKVIVCEHNKDGVIMPTRGIINISRENRKRKRKVLAKNEEISGHKEHKNIWKLIEIF